MSVPLKRPTVVLLVLGALTWSHAVIADEDSGDTNWQALASDYKNKYEIAQEALHILNEQLESLKQAEKHFKAKFEAAEHALEGMKGQTESLKQEHSRELSKVQGDLASCSTEKSTLAAAKQQGLDVAIRDATSCKSSLTKVQSELQAAKSTSTEASSCMASLKDVQQDLEHHKSKLAELAALTEDMLLPPWLALKVHFLVAKSKELYAAAASSEAAAQALQYWHQLEVAAEPHLAVVKAEWAKVSDAAWYKDLVKEVKKLEAELTRFLTPTLQSIPALAPLSDPVVVQLMVYAIFGSPLLLLVPLLAMCCGSKSRAEGAGPQTGGKSGAKKAALAEKRPAKAARVKRA